MSDGLEIKKEMGYDACLKPIDWRYCAAIVGLSRYLDYLSKVYFEDEKRYEIDEENFEFRFYQSDIEMEEEYFLFAEHFFGEDMHHFFVEKTLRSKDLLTKNDIDSVNKRLAGNTVMKKHFKSYKCSEENKDIILQLIDENRIELIRNTFQMMKKGYANYANPNLMRQQSGDFCRLVGFHIDEGRKTKGISFNFDDSIFVGRDELAFDFIPFAFTKTSEAVFINNNHSIRELIKSNKTLLDDLENLKNLPEEQKKDNINYRNFLFFTNKGSAPYIDFDVEVIIKKMDNGYFETMFIRQEAIEVFKQIDQLENTKAEEEKYLVRALNKPCRTSDDRYLPIMEITTDHILNGIFLDDLIEQLLKYKSKNNEPNPHRFLISQLIRINHILYQKKEENVSEFNAEKINSSSKRKMAVMINTKEISRQVAQNLIAMKAENKIKSYRQKLISCLVFKNYSRFMEIMLQLSSYSEVSMPFLFELAYDFDQNKNIAYTFVNNLDSNKKGDENNGK